MTERRTDKEIDAFWAEEQARREFERSPEWLMLHPINSFEELRTAIAEAPYGHDKQSQANRFHIIRRAKALGHGRMVPFSFNADGSLNGNRAAFKY